MHTIYIDLVLSHQLSQLCETLGRVNRWWRHIESSAEYLRGRKRSAGLSDGRLEVEEVWFEEKPEMRAENGHLSGGRGVLYRRNEGRFRVRGIIRMQGRLRRRCCDLSLLVFCVAWVGLLLSRQRLVGKSIQGAGSSAIEITSQVV